MVLHVSQINSTKLGYGSKGGVYQITIAVVILGQHNGPENTTLNIRIIIQRDSIEGVKFWIEGEIF